MTPDEINIAIAKTLGFKVEKVSSERLGSSASEYPYRLLNPKGEHIGTWLETEEAAWTHGASWFTGLPAFYTSRDACAYFEAHLTYDEQDRYAGILATSAGLPDDWRDYSRDITGLITASPALRCQAYLTLKGLYPSLP